MTGLSAVMKDNTKRKKHKHHRTYSDSPSNLSDNEKFCKKKGSRYDTDIHDSEFEDAKHHHHEHHHHHHHHHHRKHSRKHKRSQSVDSDSHIEVSKEKKAKHHDDITVVKIKQEPVSDNEEEPVSSRRTKGRNETDTR